MKQQVMKLFFFSVFILVSVAIQSCSSSSVGGNGDVTKPVVTLTGIEDASAVDDEIIGEATIQWTTDEPNRSTVDIYLSVDSGVTFPAVPLANDVPDTGEYTFDTNDIDDCRYCRVRIVARDVVGNESDPVDSTEDFIINNVPQVLGVALFVDPDSNGADPGDTIIVPFDKDVEVRTGRAGDVFILPVLGDDIGAYATLGKGKHPNELVITLNDYAFSKGHIHTKNDFDPTRLGRTAPSGLNVHANLSEGLLYARDTGRTASFVAGGIDIVSGFSDSGQVYGSGYALVLGDVDGDDDLDMFDGQQLWQNNGSGAFTDFGQSLGYTNAVVLGDVDGDSDLDMIQASSDYGHKLRLNAGVNSGNFAAVTQSFCINSIYGYCYTNAIALGDVDNDGDLDMVEASYGEGSRVWENTNGLGLFVDSGQLLCVIANDCSYSTSIIFGDVDGDNDLDMIEGSGQGNRVWINNGINTGIYVHGQLICQANQNGSCSDTQSLALGDVDNDGDLDLVTAGYSGGGTGGGGTGGDSAANLVWLNDGGDQNGTEGNFTNSGQRLGNDNATEVVFTDVDNDNDLDVVQGTEQTRKVWRNDGNGVFSETGQSLGNSYTQAIAVGDLDDDGDVDVFNSSSGANVWFNSFNIPTPIYYVNSEQALASTTSTIALGDVDGDGDLDRVAGSTGYGSRVWLNNVAHVDINQGVFTDSGLVLCAEDQYSNCSYTESIVLGDVDGDGDLDLVEGNQNAGNRVWLNTGDWSNGTGGFTDSGQILSFTVCTYDDINTAGCDYSGYTSTRSIVLGDVDGDGDLDVVVGNSSQSNRLWINNGVNSGTFSDSGQALSFCIVDDTNTVGCDNYNFFTPDTTNFYNERATYTEAVALGDVDGDGDLDIIAGSYGDGTQIWENTDGEGTYSMLGAAFGTANTQSIALGDVNDDGDLDLILGNTGQANQLWINIGVNSGAFSDSGQVLSVCVNPDTNTAGCPDSYNLEHYAYTYSVVLGDIDDDADLDLIVGNENDSNATDSSDASRVWLNNGAGVFSDTQTLCSRIDINAPARCNAGVQSIAIGDVDNDGDVDVVEGGSQASGVWLNDF